jgi:hypothetical protein
MTPNELLDGIRAADQHEGGLRCLRLHSIASAAFAELRSEVSRLVRDGRPSDVQQPRHVTNWVLPFGTVQQFSLLNTTGRFDDFSTDHDLARRDKRFFAGSRYPALARLLAIFPEAVNFRINVLGRRSGLSPHEEHAVVRSPAGAVVARVRFHLPVVTNSRALLVLDGDVHHLEPGVIHYINHGCVHAASNHGEQSRVHLVWDMLLTPTTFEVLFGGSTAPPPLERITGVDRELAPLRIERVGAYRRLPPVVSRGDAAQLRLAEPP